MNFRLPHVSLEVLINGKIIVILVEILLQLISTNKNCMKTIMSTIALVLFSLSSIAQTNVNLGYTSFSIPVASNSRSIGGGIITHNSSGMITSIKGSPYLNEYFLPGTIELSSGEILENVNIRYNVHNDMIEIDKDGEILEINKPNAVRSVRFDNRIFIYHPYLIENSVDKNGYFEILVEGPFTLYARRTNKLKEQTNTSLYGNSGTGQFHYKMEIKYYVKTANETVFGLNKKKFLDNINSNKSEMKNYIKKRKLKFNDELSVKKLIKYYNSL